MKKNDNANLDLKEAIDFCLKIIPLYDDNQVVYVDDWIEVGSTWDANFYYDSEEDKIKFSLYKVVDGKTDITVDYSNSQEPK